MKTYFLPYAVGPTGLLRDVAVDVEGGRIAAVRPGSAPHGERLDGVALPGFANAHSHAFHRALRGRTHGARGSFWTWRDLMYEVGGRLDPDSYYRLARAVYGEMALGGITAVGEFHYLHHRPDGSSYHDPNAMGHALVAAAADAGIRITLLDTLYLTSSVDGRPLEGVQRRFGDGDLDGWAARVAALKGAPHARIGAAVHSVRAVPAKVLAGMAEFLDAAGGDGPGGGGSGPGGGGLGSGRPLHVHLSEQRAENEQCLAVHGCTPTELLERNGLLGPGTTAVHATHLTGGDVATLGRTGTGVCFCPTTERDLADGIGPARALVDAGARLSLGSDSHAVIDMFEEIRGVEMNERLAAEERGRFTPAQLTAAAAAHGSLGWDDAGELAPGKRADLVVVRLDSVRTAGSDPEQAVFAATAADVTHVIADGRMIVADGRHTAIDVPAALREAL